MAPISKIRTPWRDEWLPASFKGKYFHVENAAKTSGRRTVVHEYPKKDIPYAEDMGRHAKRFMITGYIISYPTDRREQNFGLNAGELLADPLRAELDRRDYRVARDELISALEEEGEGTLVHPTMGDLVVVCERYTCNDAIRMQGGFCSFEMSFVEHGTPGNEVYTIDTSGEVYNKGDELQTDLISNLDAGIGAIVDGVGK